MPLNIKQGKAKMVIDNIHVVEGYIAGWTEAINPKTKKGHVEFRIQIDSPDDIKTSGTPVSLDDPIAPPQEIEGEELSDYEKMIVANCICGNKRGKTHQPWCDVTRINKESSK